jgi:uncharacterized membrane protein
MTLRWDVLAAIIGMALVTYLCRAGGYSVLRAVRPPPFVQAMLLHLPGCIFVAFLAPVLANAGWAAWAAAAVVLLVQARFGKLALSIVAGVATLWLARLAAGGG